MDSCSIIGHKPEIVTTGCGLAQRWGGPIEEIRLGDVIWFEPGEKHWHGAAPTLPGRYEAVGLCPYTANAQV